MTAQMMLAVGFSLLFIALVANLLLIAYARGVVRAAVADGAGAGSRATDPVARCQTTALRTQHALLGGPVGKDVRFSCTLGQGQITATATGSLPLPPANLWHVNEQSTAVYEPRILDGSP